MDEYRSNSFKSKGEKESKTKKPVIEKVISGKAKVKKKSEMQKIAEVFIPEDLRNVRNRIFTEIVVPAAKKIISDGVDMILYGERGSRRRSEGERRSYASYWYRNDTDERKSEHRARRDRSIYDFDNLLFETRGDAEMVLDALQDIIETYDTASVADLYDLADVEIENTTASNYGWETLVGAKAVHVPDGYVLRLPKPIALN